MNIQTFDYSADLMRALLWRNNAAPNITALIQHKQDFYDANVDAFWNSWYTDVFDLRTANQFGLSVWSALLGLTITIEPSDHVANSSWGLGEGDFPLPQDHFRKNFANGTTSFANFSASAGAIVISVEDARILLRLRYYQLTTNGNVVATNAMIEDVFAALGTGYLTDNNDMTIVYEFQFVVPGGLATLLDSYDLLPRPSGVVATFTSL